MPQQQVERKHRVLIVDTGSLVEAGVDSLLRRENDLHVSRCPYIGESALVRSVVQIQPDVMIMNESGEITAERVVELLADQLTALRLIVVQTRDNAVAVYGYRRAFVTEISDLLGLIRSNADWSG
jgi:DNA-binding NarL/FixJ family response regulator